MKELSVYLFDINRPPGYRFFAPKYQRMRKYAKMIDKFNISHIAVFQDPNIHPASAEHILAQLRTRDLIPEEFTLSPCATRTLQIDTPLRTYVKQLMDTYFALKAASTGISGPDCKIVFITDRSRDYREIMHALGMDDYSKK